MGWVIGSSVWSGWFGLSFHCHCSPICHYHCPLGLGSFNCLGPLGHCLNWVNCLRPAWLAGSGSFNWSSLVIFWVWVRFCPIGSVFNSIGSLGLSVWVGLNFGCLGHPSSGCLSLGQPGSRPSSINNLHCPTGLVISQLTNGLPSGLTTVSLSVNTTISLHCQSIFFTGLAHCLVQSLHWACHWVTFCHSVISSSLSICHSLVSTGCLRHWSFLRH